MDRPPAWKFQEGVDGKLKSNLQWPNQAAGTKLVGGSRKVLAKRQGTQLVRVGGGGEAGRD